MAKNRVETIQEHFEPDRHRQDLTIYTIFALAILAKLFPQRTDKKEPLILAAPAKQFALPAPIELQDTERTWQNAESQLADQAGVTNVTRTAQVSNIETELTDAPPVTSVPIHQEQAPQSSITPEFKPSTLTTAEAQPLALAILGNVFEKIKNFFTKNTEIRSEHDIFRADFYCRKASQLGVDKILAAMQEDARHHALETLLVELDTYYQYEVDPTGIFGGMYTENLIAMAANFIDTLAISGKKLDRASLEKQVLTFEQQWALATCDHKGQYLLITSPPGSKADGYHGIDSEKNWQAQESHHTFFFLKWAQRDQDGKVIVHTRQIRAWPNIAQLIAIQTQLNHGQKPAVSKQHPTLALIENLIFFERPDLNPDEMLNQVQKVIYQTQDSWAVKPTQLPKVDQDAFWTVQQQLMHLSKKITPNDQTTDQNLNPSQPINEGIDSDFYFTTVKPLLEQIPSHLTAADPYWQSSAYRQIIQQLDKAFTYYARALDKWVVDHNQNPHFQSSKKNTAKIKPAPSTNQQPNLIKTISRLYKTDVEATVFKQTPNRNDRQWYLANAQQFLSVANRLFSLAQCGGLAPFTAPFSMMKATGLSSFQLNMALLPLGDKLKFLQEIKGQNYVEITLGKKWMVPKEYLKLRKNGLAGCINKNGVDLGPCDIPLAQDPMALAMDQSTFNQYLQSMSAQQLTTDLFNTSLNQQTQSQTSASRKGTAIFDREMHEQSFGLSELFASPNVSSISFGQLLANL